MLPYHRERATLMEKLLLCKLAKMPKVALSNNYYFIAEQIILLRDYTKSNRPGMWLT